MMCLFVFVGDVYVHADLHGASSVVIKNPSGKAKKIMCNCLSTFKELD